MKQLTILATFFLLVISMNLHAQNTNWGIEFSEAIMERHPATINDLTNKGWEYSNSIVLFGMMKNYEYTQNPAIVSYVQKYVDQFVSNTGNISFNSSDNNLDHLHPGLLLLFLYEQTGLEKYKTAAQKVRKEFDYQPRTASGGYWHKQRYPNQMWADGIYMAEPFLLQYGALFNDLEYAANEATKQTLLLAEHAYEPSNHLIYHGWDETKSASWADGNGRSPCVWSRGMGWYCMALVDMLDYLPADHENYPKFVELVQNLAIGIKENQDAESGLWYQVVDQGHLSSNWIEVSGSAMFLYMLKKGMDKGYLDDSYTSVVEKGWNGMQTKITRDGGRRPIINDFVGGMGIKDTYNSYVAQSRVNTPTSKHPHGYCAILSLASVMEWPKEKEYKLTIETIGDGNVEIESEDSLFMPGQYVKMVAVPEGDADFLGWLGNAKGKDDTFWIEMSEAKTVKAVFSDKTSANEIKEEPLKVYPNPVEMELHLNSSMKDDQPFQVLGVDGQLVKQGVLKRKNSKINISELEKGAYILLLKSKSISFMKK